jgi:hypothetical protein
MDSEEHPEPDASEPAITRTSQMLVISEDPKLPLETTDLPPSPEVLKKKPRTGTAGKGVVAVGNLSTPLLGDVSYIFAFPYFFVYSKNVIVLMLFPLYAFQLFYSP